VDVLGSHGQTLFHAPRVVQGGHATTLQVGDGDVLAERTGILTVSDFRPRDVAAGGEGAPLIPWVDWCLWSHPERTSAALNLGSIANLTVITPEPERVLAFDVGPANALIDGLARAMPGAPGGIDRDGRLSASGRVDAALLAFLEHERGPYLARPPPKSAGYAEFGPPLVARILERFGSVAGADRVRTAVEFTALALETSWRAHVASRVASRTDLRVSGGGTRNPTLMAALRARLLPFGAVVQPLDDAFSNAKEAVGFALLADAAVHGVPNTLPSATGARRAVVAGKISL
jgi:anhydro-N-acetylmuramic acid kinase